MSILSSIYYGILIGCVLIILHMIWAMLIYKYDKDRLGNLALARYTSMQTNVPADHFYSYEDVWTDKEYMECTMVLRHSETRAVSKSERVRYRLASTCELLDLECLNI